MPAPIVFGKAHFYWTNWTNKTNWTIEESHSSGSLCWDFAYDPSIVKSISPLVVQAVSFLVVLVLQLSWDTVT